MKLSIFLFATQLTRVMVSMAQISRSIDLSDTDLRADSSIGMNILSKARRLDEGGENGYDHVDTWLSGYSIKFLGCHHIQQWNDNADDKENVRIMLKRLVRFRLCPAHTCTTHNEGGCLGDYGDYIIDLASFMDAYFEATRQTTDYECMYYYNKNCDCEPDEGEDMDEDFNAETCTYDCYAAAGLEKSCVDQNPYEDDAYVNDEFEPERYMGCARLQWGISKNATQRALDEEGNELSFYVGPFCRHQGGSVMLGMFTDDTCTEYVDKNHGWDTFRDISGGMELPYSKVSLVSSKCVSCMNKQQQLDNNNGEGGEGEGQQNQQESSVLDSCQQIYTEAGKCESMLPGNTVDKRNTIACQYLQGIKSIGQNGIAGGDSGSNGVMNFFILLFALSCAALGHYIQYLRKISKHKGIAQVLLPSPKRRRHREH